MVDTDKVIEIMEFINENYEKPETTEENLRKRAIPNQSIPFNVQGLVLHFFGWLGKGLKYDIANRQCLSYR